MRQSEEQLEKILMKVDYEVEDLSTLSLLGIDDSEDGSSASRVEGVSELLVLV